ncbi:MAG TPA: methyltransferase domain-containing protein [Myxococcaceae bacterium]
MPDVGCASGLPARTLLKAGFDVVGVDASPAMIALARVHAPGARFEALALPTRQRRTLRRRRGAVHRTRPERPRRGRGHRRRARRAGCGASGSPSDTRAAAPTSASRTTGAW